MPEFNDFRDFERAVGKSFNNVGWQVEYPPANNRGYDIEARKGEDRMAIQVKNWKVPVRIPQLEQFLDYLDLPIAARFNKGAFISARGFSPAAIAFFAQCRRENVYLGTLDEGRIKFVNGFGVTEPPPPDKQLTYIGVFTRKGGVGKTTISAHLAGAFALRGYDVALIDLDPHKNLSRLLGEGLFVPSMGNRPGSSINVFSYEECGDRPDNKTKIVICDCSPVYRENPPEIMEKLHYCIVPTSLNPLGLSENGQVIAKTLDDLREGNKEAYVFALINNYHSENTRRGKILKELLQRFSANLSRQDQKFHFIDPDEEASIRNSKQLYYWGYHIYAGGKSELAFNPVGGRCHPKADFLNLIDYLETHSSIYEQKTPAN